MKKPQTQEQRHQVKIKGLTFVDINECYYLAIMDSADEKIAKQAMKTWKKTKEIDINVVFKLNWDYIDPIAVRQNLDCWIERKMGIFPNIECKKA